MKPGSTRAEEPRPIGAMLADIAAGRFPPEIARDVEAEERRRSDASREATRRAQLEQWRRMFPGAGWETVDLHHASILGWRERAERVLAWDPRADGARGLLIAGRDSGRAKTRVCAALLHRLMVAQFVRASLWHAQDLAAELTQMQVYGGDSAREFIRALSEVPVLFIDDLGQHTVAASQDARVEAWLFRLFDRRLQLRRPCLITTNLDPAQLADRAGHLRGDPLVRRLEELCETVEAL